MEIACYNLSMNTEGQLTQMGEELRKLRRAKGYTQQQLAELSGVSRRMIVHYEKHSTKPDIDKIRKIAESLDVSVDDLLGGKKSKGKKQQENVPYKIMKKVRVVEKLSTRDQNTVFSLINALAEKNKLKQNQ